MLISRTLHHTIHQRQDAALTALMQLNEGALQSLGPRLESTGQLLREGTSTALHDATVALRMAQDAVLHEARACGERLGGENKGEHAAGSLLATLLQRVRYVGQRLSSIDDACTPAGTRVQTWWWTMGALP